MPLRKGEVIEVQFEGLSYKGYGLGRYDGREVAVPGVLPGERAKVKVLRRPRHRVVGEVVEVVESPYRRTEPRCPHFGTCGGCLWQDVPYPEQLRLKEELVREYIGERLEGSLLPILPSPELWEYRNKMEFSFDMGPGGGVVVGLHPRGRFDRTFDLKECPISPSLFPEVVSFVRDFARSQGLPPYDLRTREGLLRFLILRKSPRTGEAMAGITSAYEDGRVGELARRIGEAFPKVRGVVGIVNPSPGQFAYGGEQSVLWGEEGFHEELEVGGRRLRFRLSLPSFFQTNSSGAERLYEVVLEFAGLRGGEKVLDLFCGVGTIASILAPYAREVVGVELVEEAVEDARMNAQANGIGNIHFVAGPAEGVLYGMEGPFDLVVVDPPRAGMHPKARKRLLQLAPQRIIYVSCNPKSLGEDMEVLSGQYRPVRAQPLDLFPHTPHVETVVELMRR
ncbi:MAG: 23S rRNA (uracil(1939)-C(5))-methyltransferase RlmD [Candidatus Latescibacterota bacterium]|nr:MAG: 23S rRNA (uracil(1939)-C(5))-methyltransferase RlmD [Candidatus Latescibacterota bacterium]